MFYYGFDDILPEEYRKVDLFPEHLRKDIEEANEWVYNNVNNGVYKTGFATYVLPHGSFLRLIFHTQVPPSMSNVLTPILGLKKPTKRPSNPFSPRSIVLKLISARNTIRPTPLASTSLATP